MIEFYTVENTGWSGGVSWFHTGGTDINPLRFTAESEARIYAEEQKKELDQDSTLWRVVHTTIVRTDNKEVTTRVWSMI